jgi:ferredoxin-NADP reductase
MFTVNAEPRMSLSAAPATALRRLTRHPLLAPFNQPESWERLIAPVLPAWSWTQPLARVVRLEDETPGVRSLWLRPNRRFRGFRPGQHVLLELEIDGVRQARCFSLSSSPRADGLLRLTIRRQTEGRVSTAAHALRPGQVVRLSQAQGHFAPSQTDRDLLLLSAGSGVTPMRSLLGAMADAGTTRRVVLLHCGPSEAGLVFAGELRELAARWPALRLHLHCSDSRGRLDAGQIEAYVADWAQRETLACGPDGFMKMIETMFAAAGRREQLLCESFGRRAAAIDPLAAAHAVIAEQSEQVFTALAGQSLLEAAEAAGLTPRFGCRRGICRTCQCRKRSGSVRNLLTGQLSGAGEELIQLCISTPQSAVELAL